MIVKIHKSYRYVVAICDSNLIGKKFEEGNLQLDLTGEFYKGEEIEEGKLREIIQDMVREDATFNIVGEESIKLCLECRIIKEEGIGKIKGIPYALVLL
ncbi:MAG: DUF424 family protein [Candidatus Omnitrophica bacterium]|nr:DUF424 family protein [Candidatus Omnitrophota bacterium]